jgi:hypothetical protein
MVLPLSWSLVLPLPLSTVQGIVDAIFFWQNVHAQRIHIRYITR